MLIHYVDKEQLVDQYDQQCFALLTLVHSGDQVEVSDYNGWFNSSGLSGDYDFTPIMGQYIDQGAPIHFWQNTYDREVQVVFSWRRKAVSLSGGDYLLWATTLNPADGAPQGNDLRCIEQPIFRLAVVSPLEFASCFIEASLVRDKLV